jgi:hypothetical protein
VIVVVVVVVVVVAVLMMVLLMIPLYLCLFQLLLLDEPFLLQVRYVMPIIIITK